MADHFQVEPVRSTVSFSPAFSAEGPWDRFKTIALSMIPTALLYACAADQHAAPNGMETITAGEALAITSKVVDCEWKAVGIACQSGICMLHLTSDNVQAKLVTLPPRDSEPVNNLGTLDLGSRCYCGSEYLLCANNSRVGCQLLGPKQTYACARGWVEKSYCQCQGGCQKSSGS